MKAVVQFRKPSVAAGWANALDEIGLQPVMWDGTKPAFDLLDEEKPDLVLSEKGLSDRCRAAHPNVVVLDDPRIKRPYFDPHRFMHEGEFDPSLQCDFCYVGPYGSEVAAFVHSLIAMDWNVKIFGQTPWTIPQYLGPISDQTLLNLVESAGYYIDFSNQGYPSENYMIGRGLGATVTSNVLEGHLLDITAFLSTPYRVATAPHVTYAEILKAILEERRLQ